MLPLSRSTRPTAAPTAEPTGQSMRTPTPVTITSVSSSHQRLASRQWLSFHRTKTANGFHNDVAKVLIISSKPNNETNSGEPLYHRRTFATLTGWGPRVRDQMHAGHKRCTAGVAGCAETSMRSLGLTAAIFLVVVSYTGFH